MSLSHYGERKQPIWGEISRGPISQHWVQADLRLLRKKFRSFCYETNIKIIFKKW